MRSIVIANCHIPYLELSESLYDLIRILCRRGSLYEYPVVDIGIGQDHFRLRFWNSFGLLDRLRLARLGRLRLYDRLGRLKDRFFCHRLRYCNRFRDLWGLFRRGSAATRVS